MNEFEEKEEYENLPEEFGGPSRRALITKRVLRVMGWVVFVAVFGVLFWRMCSTANIPESVDTIIVNDDLARIYAEKQNETVFYYQALEEFTRGRDNYGYFAVPKSLIIPEANQVQVVLRYNVSTLEALTKDFPEHFPDGTAPDRNEDLFDVTLVKIIDLTPDITEDNEDENFLKFERYFPTSSVKDQTNRHNFERFLFENIDCEDALNVYVDIYYIGEVDYDGDAYGTIPVYTSDENEIRCKYFPTKADKKALEEAK